METNNIENVYCNEESYSNFKNTLTEFIPNKEMMEKLLGNCKESVISGEYKKPKKIDIGFGCYINIKGIDNG